MLGLNQVSKKGYWKRIHKHSTHIDEEFWTYSHMLPISLNFYQQLLLNPFIIYD